MNLEFNVWINDKSVCVESKGIHVDCSKQAFIRLARELTEKINNFEDKECIIIVPPGSKPTKKIVIQKNKEGVQVNRLEGECKNKINRAYMKCKSARLPDNNSIVLSAMQRPKLSGQPKLATL